MSRLFDMWRANSSNPAISRRGCVNLIMLVYFFSGACSLIDEVVWVRLLKLTLGNTVYASSIVVSTFMGGLALGALIMSRYSDRIKMHLRLYALLETLVTISALSIPWLLRLADHIYIWFYRSWQPSNGELLIVQVLISGIILLVPSMLMGSTLPLLGRFVTSLEREAGHLVGKLYALNTLGAAVGCFLAGFVLVRSLGVMGTLYTAAGLNLIVAFGGWVLSRCSNRISEEEVGLVAEQGVTVEKVKAGNAGFYILILAFFISGLISIGYEILWMRSIVHLLGGFTYVFSGVLTIYLLGNVIGAGIGSRLAKRIKTPATGFAITLLFLGLCGVFYLPVLVMWTTRFLPFIDKVLEPIYAASPAFKYIINPLVQSVFLFLTPAIIMGIGFPIALQGWANHMHKVGRSTGAAYGANTVGAVIGGIVTGFFLIPVVGVQISVSILGLIGIWIAAVLWLSFAGSSRVVGRWALAGIAVFLTIVTVKIPTSLFNVVVKESPLMPDYDLVYMDEGINTTVSVHRSPDGLLHLYSSGQTLAGENYTGRGDQKMLGHYGVMLNSKAQRVLSVGFGSGESTKCLSSHKIERIDCVEIAPEIVEVSLKYFSNINLGERLNDEVNMIYMDAKNYIHLTDIDYDSIFNDCIHPRFFAENASLYAKEYFESSKERLAERGGLFLSYLPMYNMPASVFESIIGTTVEVFPHVTVWYLTVHPAPLIVVIGSEQEQYYSPKHMENEFLKKGVRDSLSEVDINNSVDVLSCYIGDEDDIREHISGFSLNTDYSPFVEFTTDGVTTITELFRKFVMDIRKKSIYKHIDWTGFNDNEKEKWLAEYHRLYRASTYLFLSKGSKNYLERLKYCVEGLSILPNHPALLRARNEAEEELFSIAMKMILNNKIDDALVASSDILAAYPDSAIAWMIRSEAMKVMGDMSRALASAQLAVELAPENQNARFNLGLMLASAGRFDEAAEEYKKILSLAEKAGWRPNYKHLEVLKQLSEVYAARRRFEDAVVTAQKALDIAIILGQKRMAENIEKRLMLFKAEYATGSQH